MEKEREERERERGDRKSGHYLHRHSCHGEGQPDTRSASGAQAGGPELWSVTARIVAVGWVGGKQGGRRWLRQGCRVAVRDTGNRRDTGVSKSQ